MCVFTDLSIRGREKEWYADHPKTRRAKGGPREPPLVAGVLRSAIS